MNFFSDHRDVSLENLDSDDSLLSVSSLAQELNIDTALLRDWEKKFVQINPIKDKANRRYYDENNVKFIKKIHHLIYDENYTISQIKDILKSRIPDLEFGEQSEEDQDLICDVSKDDIASETDFDSDAEENYISFTTYNTEDNVDQNDFIQSQTSLDENELDQSLDLASGKDISNIESKFEVFIDDSEFKETDSIRSNLVNSGVDNRNVLTQNSDLINNIEVDSEVEDSDTESLLRQGDVGFDRVKDNNKANNVTWSEIRADLHNLLVDHFNS